MTMTMVRLMATLTVLAWAGAAVAQEYEAGVAVLFASQEAQDVRVEAGRHLGFVVDTTAWFGWLGVVGETSYSSGTGDFDVPEGAGTWRGQTATFTGGVKVRWRNQSRVTPTARVTVGLGRLADTYNYPTGEVWSTVSNTVAVSYGGGIDIEVARWASARARVGRVTFTDSTCPPMVRVEVGVVFH